jgi:hypothetical protein
METMSASGNWNRRGKAAMMSQRPDNEGKWSCEKPGKTLVPEKIAKNSPRWSWAGTNMEIPVEFESWKR